MVTAGPVAARRRWASTRSNCWQHSPRAIIVTISDFGWTGPVRRPGRHRIHLAGLVRARPASAAIPPGRRSPIGGDLGEYMGGVFAAFGALAVRRRVERGGPGEHLDLSMLEAITLMQSSEWLHSQLLQVPPIRRTTRSARRSNPPRTATSGSPWSPVSSGSTSPRWSNARSSRRSNSCDSRSAGGQYRDLIREHIGPWLAERTVEEIVELGQLFRLPIAALGNGSTIRDMDYVTERGVFVRNPAGFDQPRPPWLMSRVRARAAGRYPVLGAADDESALAPCENTRSNRRRTGLPLDGVRIVDLTAFWAGPAATHLLAAFGADVVKIESIQRPDGIRYSGGMRKDVDDWWEYGWVFHAMNTNKRSVTLDLGSDDGRPPVQRAGRRRRRR